MSFRKNTTLSHGMQGMYINADAFNHSEARNKKNRKANKSDEGFDPLDEKNDIPNPDRLNEGFSLLDPD